MFLTTHELTTLPEWVCGAGHYTTVHQPGKWGWEQPEHLARLGESGWPSPMIKAIADLFSRAGIEDPCQQKLVEPTARIFGGVNNDLSNVNWEMVVDYFTWEIVSLTDAAEAERLQYEAQRKYGGIWWHYSVYSMNGLD